MRILKLTAGASMISPAQRTFYKQLLVPPLSEKLRNSFINTTLPPPFHMVWTDKHRFNNMLGTARFYRLVESLILKK